MRWKTNGSTVVTYRWTTETVDFVKVERANTPWKRISFKIFNICIWYTFITPYLPVCRCLHFLHIFMLVLCKVFLWEAMWIFTLKDQYLLSLFVKRLSVKFYRYVVEQFISSLLMAEIYVFPWKYLMKLFYIEGNL